MPAYVKFRIPELLDRVCTWPLLLYRRVKSGQPFRKIDLGEDAYTIVDPDVYYEKCRYNWFLSGGKKAYPARTIKVTPKTAKISYLHREIIKPRKGKLVDHRDNDPFNNLRSNLRQATHSQNSINRPKRPNTSSKYIGVCWNKQRKKWLAVIRYMHKGRTITKHLCFTSNEIEAAHTFDIAALKYHKDFARTNFPREDYVKVRNGYRFAGNVKSVQNNEKDTDLNGLTRFFYFLLLPFYFFSVNSVFSVAKTSVAETSKISCPFRAKLCKIHSSIFGRFGNKRKRKAGSNYERDTLRRRPVRKGR